VAPRRAVTRSALVDVGAALQYGGRPSSGSVYLGFDAFTSLLSGLKKVYIW
jgi:hypothetical protein